MSGCVDGLVDSQGVGLFFRIPGMPVGIYEEVGDVTDIPLPAPTRTLDDVTTVKSKYQMQAAAGVITSGNLAVETLQKVGDDQQKVLMHHFKLGTCLEWKIDLGDEEKTTLEFCGTLSKCAPVRAASKKNRLQLEIGISGEVVHKENDVVVTVP